MPFYDNGSKSGRRCFKEALASMLSQSFKDYEILVVSSGEREFVDRLSKRSSKIRLRFFGQKVRAGHRLPLAEKLRGIITARNLCVRHARGRYVAFQDFDDISAPKRLEKQSRFLDAHPDIGAVGSCMDLIDAEGRTIGFRSSLEKDVEIRRHMLQFNPVPQPTIMARRALIVRAGGYRHGKIPEDFDLWVRMAAFTKFHNLQEPLVKYRVHSGGGASNYKLELFMGSLGVKERAAKTLGLAPTPNDAAVNALQFFSLFFPNFVRRIFFERIRSRVITGNKKST